MEFFTKGNNVKLRSHLDKFLIADDDQETIRQSRKGDTRRAVWTVEPVVNKPNLIRLKSSNGTYLTASYRPLQLGMTGEKVIQTRWVNKMMDWQTQWEPERDGFQLKLKSWSGKWLWANDGKPPLRNSVTHDEPHTEETKNWLIWDVITVDASVLDNMFAVDVDDDDDDDDNNDESLVSSPVFGFGVKSGSPVSSARGLRSYGRFASLSLPMSPRLFPELEPKKKGYRGKLKSWSSKWLNVKCGTPEWKNSITHEEAQTPNTKNCMIWDVLNDYALENISDGDDNAESSVSSLFSGLAPGSPASARSMKSPGQYTSFSLPVSPKRSQKPETTSSFHQKETVSPMEFFHKEKAIRIRNSNDKYLTADDDKETVIQTRNGFSINARWIVEPVHDSYQVIRLKSCYGTYLAASMERFLLGATGKKVIQLKLSQLDSSIEWEPVREGLHIKFRTRSGNYLRANSGLPPWKNSVTHDFPHLPAGQDSISWHVDFVDILIDFDTPQPPSKVTPSPHRRASNLPKTSSTLLERSDSDSVESPFKVTPLWPKVTPPLPHATLLQHQRPRRSLSSPSVEYSRTLSSLLESSDSDWAASPSKVTLPPIKMTSPSHRKLLLSVESSRTSSSLSESSDSDSVESSSKVTSPPNKVTSPSHRKQSNLLLSVKYSRTSSCFSESSDSYSVEPPSKMTLPPIKVTSLSHRKPSNLLLSVESSRTPSSLSEHSDSHSVESPRKVTLPPIKVPSLPRRRRSNLPSSIEFSRTLSFVSEKSDSNSVESPSETAGRTIYYYIADMEGNVENEFKYAFTFQGNSVAELTQTLQEETCLEDAVVCTRSPLNGKMIPLRLQLPPNSGTLYVLSPSITSLY